MTLPKTCHFLISLKLLIFFSRNFFNKIVTWNSYLSDASVKNCCGFWRRHLYSELEVIKARGKGGNFLSLCHIIAEATSPGRDVNKNKNKATHSKQ